MRATPVVLVLICSLTLLAGLGRAAVGDSDEGFYAESAREMIEGGNWLTPRYNYEYRFQKPILYYWLTAAAYLIAGVGPGSARVASALSGFGLAFLSWAIARRWYDERTALLAGLIVATSFGTFSLARLALPDMPLAFFVSVAIWAGMGGKPDEPTAARWMVAAAAAALGFLTKGPLGVLLPALVLLPVLLVERRLRELSWRGPLAACLVFATIALPWYAAMTMKHGTGYLYGFFVGDNLERFATDRFNEPRSFGFYVPIVAGGLMPWTPFGLLWIRPIRRWLGERRRLDARDTRLLIWIALPLLFFSAAVGKQPRYIIPILPPLAILLASTIARATERRERDALFTAGAAASGSLLIALALLVWRAHTLAIHSTPSLVRLATAVIGAGGAMVLVHVSTRGWRRVPFSLVTVAIATLLALHYSVLSSGGREPVEEVAAVIASQRTAGERTGPYQVLVRNLVFYTRFRQADLFDAQRLSEFLESPDRVLCALPAGALAAYEAARSKTLRRVAEVPYFNVSTVKLRALLWPDPAHDLETIVVVSNK